jgi:hypothetical protein
MRRSIATLFSLLVLILALSGCRSRTDRSSGTVVLTLGQFNGVPNTISATTAINNAGVFITSLIVQSFSKDPTGTTGPLQNVEITSYQVTYRRRDTGTRTPPTLVESVFLLVPVNSQATLNNGALMRLDQVLNPPISDLAKFGKDQETGSAVVVLDATMQFFGRTLSGDAVATAPISFTVDITP